MRQRVLLLPLLLAAHLAALGLALRPVAADAVKPGGGTITATEIPIVATPPVSLPMPVETAVAVQVEAPVVESATEVTAIGPSRGDCALTDDIQAALRADRATAAALDRMPAASRSVANALMIWDGRWSGGPGSALVPIQRIVVASIRAAPAECQVAAITGPRLIMVPDGSSSAVLAFGSGVWSWAQLLV